MADPKRPPASWRWLLRRVLPGRDRDGLMDELDQMFERMAQEQGPGSARRWYREEVMAFVMLAPRGGLRAVSTDWGGRAMEGVRGIRMVLRSLTRAPGFTALATLTLALGIGASAVVFAIADRALLRPLPYPEAHRLVSVLDGWGTSLGSLEILQREMTTVATIGGAWDAVGSTLQPDVGPARRVSVAHVSPEYLSALGLQPRLGRLFRPDESEPGRGQVALLSSDFFASEYGADSEVLGSTIALEGERFEIVGVLPPGFDLPSDRNDLWIPATMDGSEANVGLHWGLGAYSIIARMRPGATPEEVRVETVSLAELTRLANPLWTPPAGFWDDGVVTPLRNARGQAARTSLLLLLGAVGVVLLVVCANVANLLLSRGLARRRDLAVRKALGAGGTRLATGQLAEIGVLGLAGSVLGLALAVAGLELLRPLLPVEVPGASHVAIDVRVVGFTAAVAVLVSTLAGLAPALRVGRQAPATLLRESGRARSVSRASRSTTRLLVGAQMAAAVTLVAGAGLLGRSLMQMTRVDTGFEVEGRVTARLDLPPGLPTTREARTARFAEIEAALASEPAFAGVALASSIPFDSETESMAVFIPEVTDDPNNLPVVQQRRVSAAFFDVMGIPLRAGRSFDERDRVEAPPVAIVDETFAARFFPGEDPLGRMVRYPWRGASDIEIVGVVGATADVDLARPPEPTVWFPLSQMAGGTVGNAVAVARSSGEDSAALAALQRGSRAFDDRMPVSELATYPELLRDSLAGPRLLSLLLVLFAGSTLALACVGVYGVAALAARQRVREIGVRMTLGADPSEIRAGFLREGLLLALPGGILGLIVAGLAGRVLSSFLFGVSPVDPITFLGTPLLLVAVALAAAYIPARRATQVDPATVLRAE